MTESAGIDGLPKDDGPVPTTNGAPGPSKFPPITVVLEPENITLRIPLHVRASVLDLKNAIFRKFPGKPAQNGQRIVCKGKILHDFDIVHDKAKNDHGEPTVCLIVNSSAWTEPSPSSSMSATPSGAGLPPENAGASSWKDRIPPLPINPLPSSIAEQSRPTIPPPAASDMPSLQPFTSTVSIPQQWIIHQHTNAVRILVRQPPLPWLGPGDFQTAEATTRAILLKEKIGFPQKTAVNSDLCELSREPSASEGGATYTWTLIDNLPYLALTSGDIPPNKAQQTALDVLTYTFPLLPVLPNLPPSLSAMNSLSRRHRTETPQIRVINLNRPQAAGRPLGSYVQFTNSVLRSILNVLAHPTRLLIPISLIIFRAAFIVYIFGWTPDRAPGWFCAVLLWVTWEIWAIIRLEGIRLQGERGRAAGPGARRPLPVGAAPALPNNAPAAPVAPGGGNDNQLAPPGVGGNPPALGAEGLRQRHVGNGNANANGNAIAANDGAVRPVPALPAWNGPNQEPAALGVNPQFFRLVRWLATYRIQQEAQQLGVDTVQTTPDGQAASVQGQAAVPAHLLREPTRMERITTFFFLFVCTLNPEVWAKRLQELRLREGQVRMIYGREWDEREPQPGEEVDERERMYTDRRRALTGWRREYVKRVLQGRVGDEVDL